MKAEQFKQLIRAIVQEEIKKSLPTLVPQIVAEALSGKSTKSKLVENDDIDSNDYFFESLKKEMSGPSVQKPKQIKTSNKKRLFICSRIKP
jgi:hypothetical protein